MSKIEDPDEIEGASLPGDDVSKEFKTDKPQICYNIIKDAYNFTIENRKNLDEKASKIIIFSGIIISVYSGIGSIFLKDLSKTDTISINKYVFLLIVLFSGISSLIISIILALRAYKPEIWENVPSAKAFHQKYVINDEDENLIFSKLAATTVKAIENNEEKISNKSRNIRKAYSALQIGIILCALFMFIAMII